MKLKYIDTESIYYKEAVALREKLFFSGMDNRNTLINDVFELSGIHLIVLYENRVIGTGRINIENNIAVISQMAINKAYQNKGIGGNILKELISYSKEKEVSKIELSARETAISFYTKYNFTPCGDKYPSEKTKIVHQKMALKLL